MSTLLRTLRLLILHTQPRSFEASEARSWHLIARSSAPDLASLLAYRRL